MFILCFLDRKKRINNRIGAPVESLGFLKLYSSCLCELMVLYMTTSV